MIDPFGFPMIGGWPEIDAQEMQSGISTWPIFRCRPIYASACRPRAWSLRFLCLTSSAFPTEMKIVMQAEVFTKPGCPYCVAAKQLLVKKNIHHIERDITKREHLDDMIGMT